MSIRHFERGDTIIEVLFAITVFSLVAVGALSLMNQGAAVAEQSLEIGLVRQQMDSQADALRYINSAYIENYQTGGAPTDIWNAVVKNHTVTEAQDFTNVNKNNTCTWPDETGQPFALDVSKLNEAYQQDKANVGLVLSQINTALSYAGIQPDTSGNPSAQGIWVQAVQSDPTSNFYDFHITACWQAPGQDVPIKLGTIVRLYEPQS